MTVIWTEDSKRKFDATMEEIKYYMQCEYRAVELRDFKEAAFCHQMRWRLMDKALTLLVPAPTTTTAPTQEAKSDASNTN